MTCNRGDVVLVLFPDSNLRTAKRRPALVVQQDSLQTGLPQTIVAMILDKEIDRMIGHCQDMRPVDNALRHTLGL
jgi:mRNA-degrading endonuclease toxin of MazEF toxin-antitoxin module